MEEMVLTEEKIWQLLEEIPDPEIPVISILDLGVVRAVDIFDNTYQITITPTYSGCPAMKAIEQDITAKLIENGAEQVKIKTVLSPPWTTDWIPQGALEKLREYGIAPPVKGTANKKALFGEVEPIQCPHCGSKDTHMVSQFGSTACKALHKCNQCLEPFDYFKCI